MSDESRGGSGEFALGSLVAGYRLEEQIGRGGMAVVFRAYDPRLDRHVALKILAPGLALDDAFRQRFIRESRAAAAVDDPHIIPVFEAGEERGVLFIAMRFVRGGDVRTLLDREGPLSPARATEIISQVASALDSAHARGLVHRDVKPANMLLDASADDDRPDHVYLSDFGLTKASLSVTGLTSTGQFLGTLDYVAPEQVEGRGVDGRTDQYALACAAFELLTGAPPFRRDQGMAVMYAQVSEPPPLLSSRRSGLPARADAIMNRALAKAPADRYATCREFSAALRRAFGLAADSGPQAQHPPRQPTQIAEPAPPPAARPAADAAGAAGAAGGAAAAATGAASVPGAEQLPPERPPSPGGAPTEAASYPPGRRTRPGLTEPGGSGGSGGPTDPGGHGGGDGGGGDDRQPRRPWYRSPVPLAAIAVVVLIIGGGGYYLVGRSGGGNGDQGSGAIAAAGLTAPACSTSTASLTSLTSVSTDGVKVGGTPFGAETSKDGTFTFATVHNGIAVLRNGSGLSPTLVRVIPVQSANKGLTRTNDGRFLLAAGNAGAVVIDIAQAEQGVADPVRGSLISPGISDGGAVGVYVTPNDKFAFVTLQNSTKMAVFNLAAAVSGGFTSADFVGFVPIGLQPVGVAQSSDRKWLYVSSFNRPLNAQPNAGKLSIVSLHGAETKPATAVKGTVKAGCSPARIEVDGNTVWVTARDSNAVLAFSASKLISDRSHALIARVAVGQRPIGLTLADGGKRLIVADSNYDSKSGLNGDLAVIDTAAALAGKKALLGVIPAKGEPRQLTLSAGGQTLLSANQVTAEIQAVKLADLP